MAGAAGGELAAVVLKAQFSRGWWDTRKKRWLSSALP